MEDKNGFTKDDINNIRVLVNHPGWLDSLVPYYQTVIKYLENQLIEPSEERRQKYPDDYLRGCLHTLKGFLTFGQDLIAQADHEAMIEHQEELAQKENQERVDRPPWERYSPPVI